MRERSFLRSTRRRQGRGVKWPRTKKWPCRPEGGRQRSLHGRRRDIVRLFLRWETESRAPIDLRQLCGDGESIGSRHPGAFLFHPHAGPTDELTGDGAAMFFATDERIEQCGFLPAVLKRIFCVQAVAITRQPLPEFGQA